ncbi:hypothetical protein [Lysobacter sp. HA35]
MAETTTAFMATQPTFGDGFDVRTGVVIEPVVHAAFGEFPEMPEFDGDEEVGALRELHSRALTQFRDLVTALHTIAKDDDPSLNDAGRLKVAARMVAPKLEELAAVAQSEFERIDAAIAAEQDTIGRESRRADPIDIGLFPEIRSHLRSLGPAKAMAEVYRMLERWDVAGIQAVATASPYLCGLQGAAGEDVHQLARQRIAQIKASVHVRRKEALQHARSITTQALSALDAKANKFIDFKRAKGLHERETKRTKGAT